jgi:hypothetical protein
VREQGLDLLVAQTGVGTVEIWGLVRDLRLRARRLLSTHGGRAGSVARGEGEMAHQPLY